MDARNDNKREVRSGCIIVWLGHQPSDWLVFCVCVCVHWWRYSTVNKFTSVHSLPWDAGSCECCLFPQLNVWLDATLAALGGGPCYLILTSPLQQLRSSSITFSMHMKLALITRDISVLPIFSFGCLWSQTFRSLIATCTLRAVNLQSFWE